MPDPFRVSQICGDKQQTHQNGGDRQSFGGKKGWRQILTVKQLDRCQKDDCRCGDPHQKQKIGDIQPPRDLVTQGGHGKSPLPLLPIPYESPKKHTGQPDHPHAVIPWVWATDSRTRRNYFTHIFLPTSCYPPFRWNILHCFNRMTGNTQCYRNSLQIFGRPSINSHPKPGYGYQRFDRPTILEKP